MDAKLERFLKQICLEDIYIDKLKDAKIVSVVYKKSQQRFLVKINNDNILDLATISSAFAGYFPFENPQYSLVVISPNVSHKNGKNDYLFISGKDLETGEDGEHFTKLSHKRLGSRVLSKINELTSTREM